MLLIIQKAPYSQYLKNYYESIDNELTFPYLNLTSAVAITMEAGRDQGLGDKPIIGIILENDWYVAFSMDDADISIQSAIIYDEKDTIVYREEVEWLQLNNNNVHMISKLVNFYHNYITI